MADIFKTTTSVRRLCPSKRCSSVA